MNEHKKYKKTIMGTSNRHVNIENIIEKGRQKMAMVEPNRAELGFTDAHRKYLPPLPENYFGSQIDEVSSARDSIIENESQINIYQSKL